MIRNNIFTPEIARAPLARWMALSLGLHLALLAAWSSAPKLAGQRETVLSISLVSATRQSHPARLSPQHKPTQAITSRTNDRPPVFERMNTASVAVEHPASSHVQQTAAVMAGDVSDGSGQDSGTSEAYIRAQLRDDLARHFDYPLVARMRGWQGTVLLGLRVESDGRLDQVHIENSSGYAVLDRSALNSVNRLDYLTEAVAWLNGRSHDIQLPVIYRLVEN
jgi:protein TonB